MTEIGTLDNNKRLNEPGGKKDFNYYITKFFLENSRLTILALLLLIFVIATALLNYCFQKT